MSFTSETTESLLDRGFSRRQLGRITAYFHGARSRNDTGAVRISSNENPLAARGRSRSFAIAAL